MDRLLTPLESDRATKNGIDPEDEITQICLAQDAKTLRATGEWLASKMFAVPLRGVEWHIRLDQIETLKRGEMPE